MTTHFRIREFVLQTTEGEVRHRFSGDVTVLAGPTGVGKTTLLELMKFGFGGRGKLAPVARDHVNEVTLHVELGDSVLLLTRSLDADKSQVVRVFDAIDQVRLPNHLIGLDVEPSLNALLLGCLGLPVDARAAARSTSSKKAGPRITFVDFFNFLYIPQAEMNRDIARSGDGYFTPKRKAIFEILFGLTTAEVLDLQARVNAARGAADEAAKEHEAVLTFLRESRTPSRIDAEAEIAGALQMQRRAATLQDELRSAIDPVLDRETQALRDMLTESEYSGAVARAAIDDLGRKRNAFQAEHRRTSADIQRLQRMRDAGLKLADIEFVICPRCTQSLTRRTVPESSCRVCLQHDPLSDRDPEDQYETTQLRGQLTELEEQLRFLDHQTAQTRAILAERERLTQVLSQQIEGRTAARVTPRLQAFSDAASQLATAKERERQLETVLIQWDRANDLGQRVEAARMSYENLRLELETAESDLKVRRQTVLEELDREFEATIRALGVPSVTSAAIDRRSYLPHLNGQVFSAISSGGGIITATQIAYWTSLLTVAVRRRDTYFPAFLLIDSPRLALNTAEALAEALYRRITILAEADPGRIQLIVADNELPARYRQGHPQLRFDYDNPTVATIPHPGFASVTTIESDETLESGA